MCGVSVPVLQEKWTAHKCDSTLVCCVICPESFLLLFLSLVFCFVFFPQTAISAALGPLSQLRPFYLAILSLHSSLIQSTCSLFTLFWIGNASTLFYFIIFFLFSFSSAKVILSWTPRMRSPNVIRNEVRHPRVCLDKVLLVGQWTARTRFKPFKNDVTRFKATLIKLSGAWVCVCPWTIWTVQLAQVCRVGKDIKLEDLIGP